MARRRYLSTEISVDAKVNQLVMECGPFAALLYTWMIPHVEEDATITGDPFQLKLKVVPGMSNSVEEITQALEGMDRVGLVQWDREEGIVFFPTDSFYKYQNKIHASRRRTEEPCREMPQKAAECRETPQKAAKDRKMPEKAASSSFSSSVSVSSSGSRTLSSTVHKTIPPTTEENGPQKGEPEAKAKQPGCPHQKIISLYHEICPMLPRVKAWTAPREKLLKARWSEDPKRQDLDWWREFFQGVAESNFLTGKVEGRNGQPFYADLEWLIRPKNFPKVLEGKYGNRTERRSRAEQIRDRGPDAIMADLFSGEDRSLRPFLEAEVTPHGT